MPLRRASFAANAIWMWILVRVRQGRAAQARQSDAFASRMTPRLSSVKILA
jgi:hypothetical protein